MTELKHKISIKQVKLIGYDFRRVRFFSILKDNELMDIRLVEKDQHHLAEMREEEQLIKDLKDCFVDLVIFPHEWKYRDEAGIKRSKTIHYLVSIEKNEEKERIRSYTATQVLEVKVSATNEKDATLLANRAFSGTKTAEDQRSIRIPVHKISLTVREDAD